MLERRKRRSAKNRMVAYIAAGAVHVAIIGALFVNFTRDFESVDADDAEIIDTIKATTIEESDIKKQQDKLKKKDRDEQLRKEREQQRLRDLKRQSELERKQIEDLKNQQELEKKKAVELEQQRKAIALKKQQEEEKRRRELEEQKRRDEIARKKRLEEKRKQEEEDRKRRVEYERLLKEEQELRAQQEMNRLLAEEQAMRDALRRDERRTTLESKYGALISQKVRAKMSKPPGTTNGLNTKIRVFLTSSGQVRSVKVMRSSGSANWDSAVETAIYAATPLPIPTLQEDSVLHNKFLVLNLNYNSADY